MIVEIAYSMNKKIRVIQKGNWFQLQRRTVRGWNSVSKTRNRSLIIDLLSIEIGMA